MNADEKFLYQIFDNVLSNAIKFSPKDKKIYVKIYNENSECVTEITDEGPGFTEDDLSNLFIKFKKLSAKPTGGENSTGLGLSIVKKLVELQGAQLKVTNETGRGAKFLKIQYEKININFDYDECIWDKCTKYKRQSLL